MALHEEALAERGTAGDLAEVARRFRNGDASGDELSLAFANATVLCVHAESPGFLAIGEAGAGYVPLYSSALTFEAAEGEAKSFSARAADLIRLVPDGYGVIIDHGSDSQVVLPPTAFARDWPTVGSG